MVHTRDPRLHICLSALTSFVRFILGVLTVLSFKCMIALLSPVYRRGGGIKWGLVCYTAVMFSLATTHTAMNLHLQSISYIDNREFPAPDGSNPGPVGYFESLYSDAINVIPNVAFSLSNWLADGLLVSPLFNATFSCPGVSRRLISQLYRCYVIYSKNIWVITFPSLMYLGSVGMYLSSPRTVVTLKADVANIAMGILSLLPSSLVVSLLPWNLAWFSISLSLNVLLTIMIAVGLILRGRNVRAATGSSNGLGGLYKTIATMVIESSALFAVISLLVIGLWAAKNQTVYLFVPVLMEIQVCVFQRPRPLDGLSDVTTDLAGNRSVAYHSTGRQQERIKEQGCRTRTHWRVQSLEPRGVDGW